MFCAKPLLWIFSTSTALIVSKLVSLFLLLLPSEGVESCEFSFFLTQDPSIVCVKRNMCDKISIIILSLGVWVGHLWSRKWISLPLLLPLKG